MIAFVILTAFCALCTALALLMVFVAPDWWHNCRPFYLVLVAFWFGMLLTEFVRTARRFKK